MSTGGGGEGNEGNAVMSGDGSSCVVSGGVSESNCCRFPGVIQELWEALGRSHTVSNSLSISFSIRLSLWLAWEEKG